MKKLIKLTLSAAMLSSSLIPHYNVYEIKASETTSASDFVIDGNGKVTDYTGASEHVIVPEGVTAMGYYVSGQVARSHLNTQFKEHVTEKVDVISIKLPESLVIIDDYAFAILTELKQISFGSELSTIKEQAFRSCKNLDNIIFPESLTSIKSSAFIECSGLTSIVLPDSVIEIGSGAFGNCSNLESVKLPENENFTLISGTLFERCSNLKDIVIPSNVKEIGTRAFRNCTSLKTLEIPSSVSEIGKNAFQGCTNLTLTVYPNSVGYHYAVENEIPYVLKCDKESLQTLINDTRKNYDATLYTTSSYNALMNFLDEKALLINDENANEEQLMEAYSAILDKCKTLVLRATDVSNLKFIVDFYKEELSENKNKFLMNYVNLFENLLLNAEEITNDYSNVSQDDVNELCVDIEAEYLILETRTRGDWRELNVPIYTFDNTSSEGYTTASWKVYSDYIDQARIIVQEEAANASQEDIDTLKANIQKSIDNLVEVADNSSLVAKLDEVKALEEDYTTSSWNTYKATINEAEALLTNKDASQDELNSMIAKLETDKNVLKLKADTSALASKLEEVKLLENDYTTSSWNTYKATIDEAQKMIDDNSDVSQEQADTKLEELTTNQSVLVLRGDTTSLQSKIDECSLLDASNYTSSSWNKLQEAISNANSIIQDNSDKSQEDVDNSLQAINEAITNLISFSELQQSLKELVNSVDYIEEDYTPITWSNYISVLDESKKVASKEDASEEEVQKAYDNLLKAIEDLELKADKTLLQEAISNANTYKKEDYTEYSYKNLENTLESATTILNDENATQQEVDNAIKTINDVISKLVDQSKLDALNELVNQAKTIDSSKYFATSIESLNTVLTKIEDSNINEAEESVLTSLTMELGQTMNELVLIGDKTELNTLISEVEALNKDDYTKDTYAILETALQEAKTIVNTTEVTQEQVDNAKVTLQNAKDGLVIFIPANKDALQQAITAAKEAIKDAESKYTIASENVVKDAIIKAESLNSNEDATQKEVDDMVIELNETVTKLEAIGDYKALDEAIELTNNLNQNDYTAESWEKLGSAVDVAWNLKLYNKRENAETVNAAIQSIKDALKELVFATDKTELAEKITQATSIIKNDESKYTPSSFNNLKTKLETANNVNSNEKATQEEIDQIVNDLKQAIENLIKRANLTALQQALSKAKNIDKYAYTKETYDSINHWIKEAERIISNTNASQNEVDTITNKLNWVVDNAIYKPFNFKDVKKEAWYYKVVRDVYYRGIMLGTSDDLFSPNAPLSRGMVATVLYRMAGSPNVSYKAKFSDVKSGLWYSVAITWAVENGVASGYLTGEFGPDDNITREDLAVMLKNYAEKQGLKTNANVDLTKYKDYKAVTAYAKTSVEWAVANGLMGGDALLKPTGKATRAESAKMFLQLFNMIKK